MKQPPVDTAEGRGGSRVVASRSKDSFKRLCLSWLTLVLLMLLLEVTSASSSSNACTAPICRVGTPCEHDLPECASIPTEGQRLDWIELTPGGFRGKPTKTGSWNLLEILESNSCPIVVVVLDAFEQNTINVQSDCDLTLHRELLRTSAMAQRSQTVSIGDQAYVVSVFKNLEDVKKSANGLEASGEANPTGASETRPASMTRLSGADNLEPRMDNKIAMAASNLAADLMQDEPTGIVEVIFDDSPPDDYQLSGEDPFAQNEEDQGSESTARTAPTKVSSGASDEEKAITLDPVTTPVMPADTNTLASEKDQTPTSAEGERSSYVDPLRLSVFAGELFSFSVGVDQPFRVVVKKARPRALWLYANDTTYQLQGFTLFTSLGVHFFSLWSLAEDNFLLAEGLVTIRSRDLNAGREINHRFITEENVRSKLANAAPHNSSSSLRDTIAYISSLVAANSTASNSSSDAALILSVSSRQDRHTVEWVRQSLLDKDICSEDGDDTSTDIYVLPDSDQSRMTMFVPACSTWKQVLTQVTIASMVLLMVCIPLLSCAWAACRKPTSIMASNGKDEQTFLFST